MKKKTTAKKLRLSRETVTQLDDKLTSVAGGIPTFGCSISCPILCDPFRDGD